MARITARAAGGFAGLLPPKEIESLCCSSQSISRVVCGLAPLVWSSLASLFCSPERLLSDPSEFPWAMTMELIAAGEYDVISG